jgi:hypothetical protein
MRFAGLVGGRGQNACETMAHKNLGVEPNSGPWPAQWHLRHWSCRSRNVLERALDPPGTTTDGPGLSRSFDHCETTTAQTSSRSITHHSANQIFPEIWSSFSCPWSLAEDCASSSAKTRLVLARDPHRSPGIACRVAPPSSTVNCAVSFRREFDRGGKRSIFRVVASSCQSSPHAVNRSFR